MTSGGKRKPAKADRVAAGRRRRVLIPAVSPPGRDRADATVPEEPSGRATGKEAGMAEQDEILVVSPSDRKPGPSTPGMDRQQAVATDSMWSGVARTQVGMVSGWHHHGEYETTI